MIHRVFTLSAIALICLLAVYYAREKQQADSARVWAAITFNHALYTEGWTDEMVTEFAVFNDGETPADVNPCIDGSTLVINGAQLSGKEYEWFSFNLGNGPRSLDPLPAGRGTYIVKGGFSRFFQKPGLYKVVWKSDCFESQPVYFRVMPRQDK